MSMSSGHGAGTRKLPEGAGQDTKLCPYKGARAPVIIPDPAAPPSLTSRLSSWPPRRAAGSVPSTTTNYTFSAGFTCSPNGSSSPCHCFF